MSNSNGYAHSFRRWLVASSLALVSLTAFSGNLGPTTLATDVTYTTGVFRYGDGTGTPTTAWSRTTITVPNSAAPSTVGPFTMGSTGSGSTAAPAAYATNKLPIPNSGGRTVPVEVKLPIPRASAAMAIAKFGMKLAYPLSVGMAVFDLAKDLGLRQVVQLDGTSKFVEERKVQYCVNSVCYEYWSESPAATGFSVWSSSPQEACDVAKGKYNAAQNTYVANSVTAIHTDPTDMYCQFNLYTKATGIFYDYRYHKESYRTVPPVTEVIPVELTEQELADRIAAQSGWPTNASRALSDSITGGQVVPHDPPVVSGPASVAGPATTTTEPAKRTNPDGSTTTGTTTKTTTPSYTINYNSSSVGITNNSTTTSVTNWTDGSTTNNGNTTSSEETKPPEPPEDPCLKNPERLGCVKLGDPADGTIPKRDVNVSYAPQDLGLGQGQCPAPYTWSDSLGPHSISLSGYCSILSSVVKPLIIAFATLAAFFIIGGFRGEN